MPRTDADGAPQSQATPGQATPGQDSQGQATRGQERRHARCRRSAARGATRGASRSGRRSGCRGLRQLPKSRADHFQAIFVVLRGVVGYAADGGVQARAAQRFGIDDLPGGALHQVGPAEAHEADAFHHNDDVAQRRMVRTPGDAPSHHRGDLRNAELAPHHWPGKMPS